MKLNLALLLICSFVFVDAQQTAPFSLSISAEKSEVTNNGDVYIQITMTNTSNHDENCTSVYNNGVNKSYQYHVYSADGKKLPNISRKHPEMETGGSAEMCTLKPGESLTQSSLISRLVAFQGPGNYIVQVSRRDLDDPKGGAVMSNKITITISN
ncbi:MAG: hypothetical protein ROO76_10205 [Terriglobia bacterium]|jgi:hypothetical protein|nr:hypothetical protein [Terriglobia bacterium]